jgi:hypothetical protein
MFGSGTPCTTGTGAAACLGEDVPLSYVLHLMWKMLQAVSPTTNHLHLVIIAPAYLCTANQLSAQLLPFPRSGSCSHISCEGTAYCFYQSAILVGTVLDKTRQQHACSCSVPGLTPERL